VRFLLFDFELYFLQSVQEFFTGVLTHSCGLDDLVEGQVREAIEVFLLGGQSSPAVRFEGFLLDLARFLDDRNLKHQPLNKFVTTEVTRFFQGLTPTVMDAFDGHYLGDFQAVPVFTNELSEIFSPHFRRA
jgi:hypothetical protein